MSTQDEKEKRIRAITRLYYAKREVREALIRFAVDREVVPRYFEGFGKRPDTLQYPSDIMGIVLKGGTSFHASEELWHDPLKLTSEMTQEEMNELRKSWDLLIDIDSPFLDYSKIAAYLLIAALEQHGVKHYGIKFSGSKGFHVIVSGKAFPKEYQGMLMEHMFPAWPRIICAYLMSYIRGDYNKSVGEILTDFDVVERRTNISKEELTEVFCLQCNTPAKKDSFIVLVCPVCGLHAQRSSLKITKRRLKCLNEGCAGILEIAEKKEYFYCQECKDPEHEKLPLTSTKYPSLFEQVKGVSAAKIASLDLVLVAPRHLFRMPYSLHEKTALASIVLKKEELPMFFPRDADPLRVKIAEFLPSHESEEARRLLAAALEWKRSEELTDNALEKRKYSEFKEIDLTGVTEEMFPSPIKKLLGGLYDGKKRGLFILITFLKALNFPLEYIYQKVHAWNALNKPPLKEGYLKSQLDWHFRQKRKVLPPNYDNESFYKDLNLLDERPQTKNPLVDVLRALRKVRNV